MFIFFLILTISAIMCMLFLKQQQSLSLQETWEKED